MFTPNMMSTAAGLLIAALASSAICRRKRSPARYGFGLQGDGAEELAKYFSKFRRMDADCQR